jgi:hypothetical protein
MFLIGTNPTIGLGMTGGSDDDNVFLGLVMPGCRVAILRRGLFLLR